MFDNRDFENIDHEYFQIINETCYHLTLKSKNTGHIWDITSRENPNGRSILVYHKHKDMDPFHEQVGFHPKTIEEAEKLIKEHDTWQINNTSGPSYERNI